MLERLRRQAAAMASKTLVQLFFDEENIRVTLKLLLLSAKHAQDDVTGYVCCAMFPSPVSFAFTEFGVAPYNSFPDLVNSYENMSRRQLQVPLDLFSEVKNSPSIVTYSKMHTGFFVEYHCIDLHFVPCSHVLSALDALMQEFQVPGSAAGGFSSRVQDKRQRKVF